MQSMRKIRILHHWVPEYRVALYEGLGRVYPGEVEIFASREGAKIPYQLKGVKVDYNHPFSYFGPVSWQKGLTLRGLVPRRDIVVINGDIREISSIWAAVKAKMLGIKVLWWAQHRGSSSTNLSAVIRLFISRLLSDEFICYTRTGVEYLVEKGFKRERVFATGNTIDQAPIRNAIDYWTQERLKEFRKQAGIEGKKLFLCCGYMRPKVRLDLFIRAMSSAKLKNVHLVVIGDGDMKSSYNELAKSLGVDSRIVWRPATHDQKEMAPWFLSAKAFVYPGSIGLSILHSLSYGLPVITHGNVDHQMPEFEVMENGRTGYTFSEGNVDELIHVCGKVLADENRLVEMSKYSQRVAFEKYSMAQMVKNFSEAIDATFSLYEKR